MTALLRYVCFKFRFRKGNAEEQVVHTCPPTQPQHEACAISQGVRYLQLSTMKCPCYNTQVAPKQFWSSLEHPKNYQRMPPRTELPTTALGHRSSLHPWQHIHSWLQDYIITSSRQHLLRTSIHMDVVMPRSSVQVSSP